MVSNCISRKEAAKLEKIERALILRFYRIIGLASWKV